ncbi:MAG TPA: Uma2 family endonuclease [Blastocatellia bacterium]
MSTETKALLEDLYEVPGKAELVDGGLLTVTPTGFLPGYAGDEIFVSLREHSRHTRSGIAVGDNKAFLVNLPNRQSFSPDAALYVGKIPGMKFFDGAPIFTVEVRSENDYGPKPELEMAQKRADYFAGGTLVVWDVDLLSEDVVKVYRATNPDHPDIFRRGDIADAEPAVPGWRFPVDSLFYQYFIAVE